MAASLRVADRIAAGRLAGRTIVARPSRHSAILPPPRLGKSELREELAETANLTKKQAAEVLEALLTIIEDTVAAGESVTIPGFGTFKRRERNARNGRNPQTGEPLQIPAKNAPAFVAGKGFKDKVAGIESKPRAKRTPAAKTE
eukprot:jgi/Chrzof1/2676/Cz11g24240.t1